MEMSRSDGQPTPQGTTGPESSALRLLGLRAGAAGHLGLCRGVAMHAELSQRFYAEGRPPQGLPPGWTPWCNPGFLVRALQELVPQVRDEGVRRLCECFIAQARALDGVNEALAALLAEELGRLPTSAEGCEGQGAPWARRAECAPLTARLQSIEEESEQLWRRLEERLAQIGGEEPRPGPA